MDYDYQQQQQQQQQQAAQPEGQFDETNVGPFNGEEGVELEEDQPHQQYEQEGDDDYYQDRIDHQHGGEEIDRKAISSSRDSSSLSSAGKLFVGGLSWETSEDTFANYFSKFGEITDSVIMTDRHSGRPRGFGFVTFADVAVADRVIEQDHSIDGRVVEVKRTVPREDTGGKGVKRTKKIFIGGIPPSFTEEELKEHFSVYGGIVEHQIMLDHKTGRSRGFGFVTFESEESVDQIFSEGKTHDLGGKRVEIKKAEPKRPGGDFGGSKSQVGYSGGAGSYGPGNMSGGQYGGKVGNGFGGYGNYGAYSGYNNYGGGYAGGSSGFYGAYGSGAGYGYGFGYGGPMMYGGVGGGYGGSNFNGPSGYGRTGGGYGGGRGYGRSEGGGGFGTGKGYANGGAVSGGYGGGKGYGGGATGSGASSGRFHPYRK